MRLSTPTIAAAALAILVAPACAPVRAEAPWGASDEGYAAEEPYELEDAPDPGEYRRELAPYGEWRDVPDYGVVWRPTYAAGWQPYVDGYWAWTSYGWTWVSYEPWAWTLHYGRWVTVPAYGWVWVPGTVWGPAWVDWYWGAGYVGWAPLSPFGSVTVINNFVFVSERDFCSRSVRRHVVHHRHVSDRVRRDWNDRRRRSAPGRERIERVSRDGVTRIDGRPKKTLAPRRDREVRHAGARLGRRDAANVSRSGWIGGADPRPQTGVRGRAPAGEGRAGSSRGQPRDERAEPRVQAPRFDRDDAGRVQVRSQARGRGGVGRDNPSPVSDAGPRRSGGGQRREGGRGQGGHGVRMGTSLAPGLR